MEIAKDNREEWLNKAARLMAPHFVRAGHPLPQRVRMTCGFPSRMALSTKKRRIGECWDASASGDKHSEVFISPMLADGVKVLGVLAHELSHAAVGVECGHKGPFAKLVKALGLEGKPTQASEGAAFKQSIADPIMGKLGAYPHAELIASATAKKQTTRMIKCVCPECGYTVRTTRAWLDLGAPICPMDEIGMEEGEA